ncbi:hypothetical protein [Streptomyces filamentosus]|uniref:hypothetical protein n=1 Tax=Streptomyces filamentosus TaxID=67294 RepID=UPI0033C14BF7
MALPTGPGLGIEVDAKAVERAAETGHRRRNPAWRRDDGSLAEWWPRTRGKGRTPRGARPFGRGPAYRCANQFAAGSSLLS